MAVLPAKITEPDNDGVILVTWETLTDGDSGEPVLVARYADKTVHSDGSYSGSGSITMQGSNNNTAWFTLSDHADTDISLTADTVGAVIAQNPLWIRPLVASGDGSTDIDVFLVCAPRR